MSQVLMPKATAVWLVENTALSTWAGSTAITTLGTISTDGARDVTNGYTVLASDNLITVNDSGTVVINLPAATARVAGTTTSGLPITIKNVGSGTNS